MQYWDVIGCKREMSPKSLLSDREKDDCSENELWLQLHNRINF